MKRLESSFNPDASKIIEDLEKGRYILLDHGNIAFFGGSLILEPTTSNEAWNCEDLVTQDKWRMAIKKEFHDMELRKV
jgi:hypothetical protein